MKMKIVVLAAAGAALAASPALAHHSAAMFDAAKQVTLVGTVKEFQFTNPHSWIQLNVPDATGKMVEWSLETGGVSSLYKRGVRASSLKPGDKVTVVAHPLKNGNPGANVRAVTTAEGKQVIGGGGG
jgi:hypothetical protein